MGDVPALGRVIYNVHFPICYSKLPTGNNIEEFGISQSTEAGNVPTVKLLVVCKGNKWIKTIWAIYN